MTPERKAKHRDYPVVVNCSAGPKQYQVGHEPNLKSERTGYISGECWCWWPHGCRLVFVLWAVQDVCGEHKNKYSTFKNYQYMRAEAVTFPLDYICSNQACQAAGNLHHALYQNRSSTRILLLISQFLMKENDGSEKKSAEGLKMWRL